MKKITLSLAICAYLASILSSCSATKRIEKEARIFISDSILSKAHLGISIYEPATASYWYNYQEGKYFIPCSNVKLFTLYAGMKYLGDSLTGLNYFRQGDTIYAFPSGDPTLLHPDFSHQPVEAFLKNTAIPVRFINNKWKSTRYGAGWAWDDYQEPYMPERSALPVYGNTVTIRVNSHEGSFSKEKPSDLYPAIPGSSLVYTKDSSILTAKVKRNYGANDFEVKYPGQDVTLMQRVPFVTNGISTALEILHARFPAVQPAEATADPRFFTPASIKSQPSDSVFRYLMYNSDNFFAEQVLLMASDSRLGFMDDRAMVDTLLSELSDINDKPRWVDGSGLSRYNLFTPRSFVQVLDKLQTTFGLNRLTNILPAGGEGTLKNLFLNDSKGIYAKTGTLSNNTALSGYLITRKGKLLIFSILANNYRSGAAPVRAAIEKFLVSIRKKF